MLALQLAPSKQLQAYMHLIRLELNIPRVESYVEHRCKLPLFDIRYTTHMALSALGLDMVRPFSIEPMKGECLPILGYSKSDASCITNGLDLSTEVDGEILAMLEPTRETRIFSKPMHLEWQVGDELRFTVNVCPVIHKDRQELDVFLFDRKSDPTICREESYWNWLTCRLKGAELLGCDIQEFDVRQILRRTQGQTRTVSRVYVPEAILAGRLRITDLEVLRQTVLHGIGRARWLGFGMLKLFPG